MHIGDALSAFGRVGIVASGNSQIFLTRDGIDRKFAHISRRNEFIERLWQLPFVGAVLIEKRSHFVQIVSQDGLTRVHDCFLVLRQGDGREDDDNRNNDHQLKQRKAAKQSGGVRWQASYTVSSLTSAVCPLSSAYCRLSFTSHYTFPH